MWLSLFPTLLMALSRNAAVKIDTRFYTNCVQMGTKIARNVEMTYSGIKERQLLAKMEKMETLSPTTEEN